MIAVVNLGISNIGSVCRALKFLRIEHTIISNPDELKGAKKILLPGVGSFKSGAAALHATGFRDALCHRVRDENVPLLGICLGMQLLFEEGREGGVSKGLGLVQGSVGPLDVDRAKFAVPHIGWNDVTHAGMTMFREIQEGACFYFVHSFEGVCTDPKARIATTNYGNHTIVAAVQKDHLWGTQFHTERSQKAGLQLLKNFSELPC